MHQTRRLVDAGHLSQTSAGCDFGYRQVMQATTNDPKPLRAMALVCTLTPSPAASSSQLMAEQILGALAEHDVTTDLARVVDHHVAPGVDVDMGDGDQWPQLRERVLRADVFVLATPTWVGHMSSVGQRVLERLNAESSQTDDRGRPTTYGKVATMGVVGNEDGAHKIIADGFQALNDSGFTIPAQGGTYWNAEAMNPRDYKDLAETPEAVAATTKALAANAAHLARLLRQQQYTGSSA